MNRISPESGNTHHSKQLQQTAAFSSEITFFLRAVPSKSESEAELFICYWSVMSGVPEG